MTLDRDQWFLRSGGLLDAAAKEAHNLQHQHIGAEHLFITLTRIPGSATENLLRKLRLDPTRVREDLIAESGTGKGFAPDVPSFTPRLSTVLSTATADAAANASLTETNLLIALLKEGDSLPVRYLTALGHSAPRLIEYVASSPSEIADATRVNPQIKAERDTRLDATSVPPPVDKAPSSTTVPGARLTPSPAVPVTMPTPMLDQWGRDMTKTARMGNLADATGRDNEIQQIVTILARTQKSNPLLLGEAGVGKTAVVEGLAWPIVNGLVPPVLIGKRIVELNMGSLTAGTTLRGQFEERIRQILSEAASAPEVVLFIDEIHTIVGAGAGEGATDAAQMFKPALARGDLSCIGATTQAEYAKFIRKDQALERRFSPVVISELSQEATLAVLEKVGPRIVEKQATRNISIHLAPEALAAAVTLTSQYVKDRHQPDKSIDALDLACASAVVKGHTLVTAEDIASVISDWTGIPARQLTADERQRFANMELVLRQRVVGQEAAISAVCSSVRAALAGMKQPNRPVGVFLFLGPSGVGKTQLAKELAAFLFHTPDALIRFDMNEYQEKHSVNNLIGSARGYLGSEQGGQFTEALRKRPFSVVLLDEIEKAHPDIWSLFLSVFDEGRITDNQGRLVDCSHATFILTSNLGLSTTRRFGDRDPNELRGLAEQFLKPELVNRITDIVEFGPLGKAELSRVLDRILWERISGFEKAQNFVLTLDESVKQLILNLPIDPRMGARPLEREVEKRLVQPLVEEIYAGRLDRSRVQARTEDGRIVFVRGEQRL